MPTDLARRLADLVALLDAHRDVVEGRVLEATAPAWCVERCWDAFLGGLDDAALERCERGDLEGAPADLRALAREASRAPDVAPLPLLGASPRKRAQVAALVELCRGRAPARVVDVGAGRGHLTRALAAALGVPAVGLEREATRVERARELGGEFEAVAVTADTLAFEPGDLAVALHACGALGDDVVRAAARDRADLVLVACCPQKVPTDERAPLSRGGPRLRRDVLGLANAPGSEPVFEARAVRVAARALLRARGVEVALGDEARGVPRTAWRTAEGAQVALARRGLPPATAAELDEALRRAREHLARVRRWSLPRRLLGVALEEALALDRACALEEAGARAEVLTLFAPSVSPRNTGVTAAFSPSACSGP